eukprot:COSAG02_NODE_45024_length_361_cov_0.545802_1_plen_61_part_10
MLLCKDCHVLRICGSGDFLKNVEASLVAGSVEWQGWQPTTPTTPDSETDEGPHASDYSDRI